MTQDSCPSNFIYVYIQTYIGHFRPLGSTWKMLGQLPLCPPPPSAQLPRSQYIAKKKIKRRSECIARKLKEGLCKLKGKKELKKVYVYWKKKLTKVYVY